MIALARSPIGLSALIASRSMSPVESWTRPRPAIKCWAWVPFPAPGGPSRMMFIWPSLPRGRVLMPSAPPAALQLRLPDEVAILVGDEVALDLGHRVHRHVDDDQQAGAAEAEAEAELGDRIFGDEADDGEVSGADHGHAGQHVIEIFLGPLARAD